MTSNELENSQKRGFQKHPYIGIFRVRHKGLKEIFFCGSLAAVTLLQHMNAKSTDCG
jgi:hypothetical protein